jgi:hypothetical protein
MLYLVSLGCYSVGDHTPDESLIILPRSFEHRQPELRHRVFHQHALGHFHDRFSYAWTGGTCSHRVEDRFIILANKLSSVVFGNIDRYGVEPLALGDTPLVRSPDTVHSFGCVGSGLRAVERCPCIGLEHSQVQLDSQ